MHVRLAALNQTTIEAYEKRPIKCAIGATNAGVCGGEPGTTTHSAVLDQLLAACHSTHATGPGPTTAAGDATFKKCLGETGAGGASRSELAGPSPARARLDAWFLLSTFTLLRRRLWLVPMHAPDHRRSQLDAYPQFHDTGE